MKNSFLTNGLWTGFFFLFATTGLATDLNYFQCKTGTGENELSVTYSTNSFTGHPLFSVVKGGDYLAPLPGKPAVIDTYSSKYYTNVAVEVGKKTNLNEEKPFFILRLPTLHEKKDDLEVNEKVKFMAVFEMGSTGGKSTYPSALFRVSEAYALECVGQKIEF
jgi:hypothetical protein